MFSVSMGGGGGGGGGYKLNEKAEIPSLRSHAVFVDEKHHGRKKKRYFTELRSSVKVGVAVLSSPSQIAKIVNTKLYL